MFRYTSLPAFDTTSLESWRAAILSNGMIVTRCLSLPCRVIECVGGLFNAEITNKQIVTQHNLHTFLSNLPPVSWESTMTLKSLPPAATSSAVGVDYSMSRQIWKEREKEANLYEIAVEIWWYTRWVRGVWYSNETRHQAVYSLTIKVGYRIAILELQGAHTRF